MNKILEREWEAEMDRIVNRAGNDVQNAIEKNWKDYFIYFSNYFLKSPSNSLKSVLDIGSGAGTIAKYLSNAGFNVTGVDFSSRVVEAAKKNYPDIDFKRSTIYNMPFPDASFDGVISLGVFQTIAEPEKALAEMNRVLRKKGVMVIRTLNLFSMRSARDQTLNFYNPFHFIKMLKAVGTENISLKGIYFFPSSSAFWSRIIVKLKLHWFFNLFFFPVFLFFAPSFYITSTKK